MAMLEQTPQAKMACFTQFPTQGWSGTMSWAASCTHKSNIHPDIHLNLIAKQTFFWEPKDPNIYLQLQFCSWNEAEICALSSLKAWKEKHTMRLYLSTSQSPLKPIPYWKSGEKGGIVQFACAAAPGKVGPCFPWLVDDMKSAHDYGTCLVFVTDGAHKSEIKLCELTLIFTKSWKKQFTFVQAS